MTYDNWKTTDPADAELGDPITEEAEIIEFWRISAPEHECSIEAQTMMASADALCRRFLDYPDIVRAEIGNINAAHHRLSLLLSAMSGRVTVE